MRRPETSEVNLLDREYPAATTMEAKETQLISMAYDLVEKRIKAGTATAAETVHFLRLGSERGRLEQKIMEEQKKLVTAKTGAYDSAKRLEGLYTDAINAMRSYAGMPGDSDNANLSEVDYAS